jgi:ribose-phosphate pyrophosphokinase
MPKTPLLLAGTANKPLAEAVARKLGRSLSPVMIERFPDGEVHVEIQEAITGRSVFLIQPTSPPPDENVVELLALADACRRGHAGHVTAVIPYFGYARQDRRASGLESVTGRVVADCIVASGVQRVVTLDLHTDALEGFFTLPVERLTAVPLLAEALKATRPDNGVIVAPDLGAAKLADRYGKLLELPVAVVHKTRLGPEEVAVSHVTGDVRDRVPIVIDDMISTGRTIEAAINALVAEGAQRRGVTVAATHGLFVGSCIDRLRNDGLQRLLVTDSVAHGVIPVLPLETVSVAALLADAIRRLHDGT